MNNYYIHVNGKNDGPFSLEEIRRQELKNDTRVWRDDQEDWKTAADFPELADFILAASPPPLQQSPPMDPYNQAPPFQQNAPSYDPPPFQQRPTQSFGSISENQRLAQRLRTKFNQYLGFTIAGIVLMFFLVIVAIAASAGGMDDEAVGVMAAFMGILFLGTMIPALVFFCQTLYLSWQAIDDDNFARTTPGRAVGFLFIPFFNLYWIFVAYHGLAQDLNQYISRHNLASARRANEGTALAYCILNILCNIPIINYLALIPMVILFFITMNNLKNSAVSVYQAKAMETKMNQIQ